MNRIPTLMLLSLGALMLVAYASCARRDDPAPAEEEPQAAAPVPVSLPPKEPEAENRYLGVAACKECHAERVQEYMQTSHYLALRLPSDETITPSFEPGENILRTSRDDFWYEMTKRPDGYYQTAVGVTPEGKIERTEQIALVMGSSKVGQSYLYWRGDELYQLPVGYFEPLGGWSNSPGFPEREPWFERPITARCLECHSTYFEHIPGTINRYNKQNFVAEISCERCHGPGTKHVEYHRMNPGDYEAKHIVSPHSLDLELQLDMCAQCHANEGRPVKPHFTYVPGEPLEEYMDLTEKTSIHTVVHSADQFAPLRKSKCFEASGGMSCTACHDPHVHERDDLARFSQRCLDCHQTEACGMHVELGDHLRENCIDCHMPKRDDRDTPFNTPEGDGLPLMQVRDHEIRVFPTDTEKYLVQWYRSQGTPEKLAAADELAAKVVRDEKAEAARLIDQAQVGPAIMIYRRSLELTPNDAELYYLLGVALASQEKLKPAMEAFTKAIELKPDYAEAYRSLGFGMKRLGRARESIEYLREALRLRPNSVDVARELSWTLSTHADAAIRNGSVALALAQTLCEYSANRDAGDLEILAAAYAELGQFDQAIAAQEQALELERQHGSVSAVRRIEERLRMYKIHQPFRVMESSL